MSLFITVFAWSGALGGTVCTASYFSSSYIVFMLTNVAVNISTLI